MIEAVVFDMDGVLVESEEVWDAVRERYVRERGGRYDAETQRAMMGMSSPEWSRFLHEHTGVSDTPDEIIAEVVRAHARRLPRPPAAHPRCGRRPSSGSPRAGRSRSPPPRTDR